MRIVGIDPGLEITGYAVLDCAEGEVSIVDAGIIKTNRRWELAKRLVVLSKELGELLDEHEPRVMAVEELYSHYRFPRTSILMGHARGVILEAAGKLDIKVMAYAATRVKKSITGNGRASKEQVQMAVKAEFKLNTIPRPADVADALAIGLCCARELEKEELAELAVKK
jgi:crossover junction endodeoxyribonuclease RuvC